MFVQRACVPISIEAPRGCQRAPPAPILAAAPGPQTAERRSPMTPGPNTPAPSTHARSTRAGVRHAHARTADGRKPRTNACTHTHIQPTYARIQSYCSERWTRERCADALEHKGTKFTCMPEFNSIYMHFTARRRSSRYWLDCLSLVAHLKIIG